MPRLASIHVYPIKACAGVPIDGARVVARGLEYDRRWMVVDEGGAFVTQRDLPRLALVQPTIEGATLAVSAPGVERLVLPLEPPEGKPVRARVWRSEVEALEHASGSAWLGRALGRRLGLVYMPDGAHRPVSARFAGSGYEVGFADGYPFLLVSEASLTALNQRLGTPLAMARFRPNLVVSGTEPYAEDEWTSFRIGAVAFRNVKPCDRCSVTTIDPSTGERGVEPLKTLATYRRRDGKVWFGVNLVHDSRGTLRVGSPVEMDPAS